MAEQPDDSQPCLLKHAKLMTFMLTDLVSNDLRPAAWWHMSCWQRSCTVYGCYNAVAGRADAASYIVWGCMGYGEQQ